MTGGEPEPGGGRVPWLWTGSLGAVLGLLAGLVAAQLLAAALYHWLARVAAHPFWEIAAPLLALLGAGGGYLLFASLFGRRLLPAAVAAVAVLGVLAALCAAVGFPWHGS